MSGFGSTFEQRAGAEGRDVFLIDGLEVPEAAYHDRLAGMQAQVRAVELRAREAFEAEAAEMNAVSEWLQAEAEWTAEHPDPDAPIPIRPSELQSRIDAAVSEAIGPAVRAAVEAAFAVSAHKGTAAGDNETAGTTPAETDKDVTP